MIDIVKELFLSAVVAIPFPSNCFSPFYELTPLKIMNAFGK